MRVVLAVMLIAARASAAPPLVWRAPPACPDADDVRARVEARLGDGSEVRDIAVTVTHAGTAFVAEVATPRGVRTLESEDCGELADAVAVVVARLAQEARDVAPPVTAPPAVALPRRWHFGLRAMVLAGVRTLPRLGVGCEASVVVRRESAFAELGAARWASRAAYLADSAPGRVDVGLDVVTARVGWAPGVYHVSLGGELGAMRGQGVGLVGARDGRAPWFAVTAGAGAGVLVWRDLRLVGRCEVAVPTSTVTFALVDGRGIYTTSSAAARCALGLELGLP